MEKMLRAMQRLQNIMCKSISTESPQVWGFPNKVTALQYEWAWQNPGMSKSGKQALQDSITNANPTVDMSISEKLRGKLERSTTRKGRVPLTNEDYVEVAKLLLTVDPFKRLALNVHI